MNLRKCLVGLAIGAITLFILAAFHPPARHPLAAIQLLVSSAPTPLPMPVRGISARQIADTRSAPRGGGRLHKGVDIFAACGTPVQVGSDGLVLWVGELKLGGKAVFMLGPGRYVHYYAHLSAYGIFRSGDRVKGGDIIGFVENTGNAVTTPCHLHYGLYVLGIWAVNPYPRLVHSPARR